MNKILVTGATGLLGSSLVPYLKKIGYMVVTHAHKTQADVMFDITNRVKTHEILEQIQPDVIVNLVGLTNVELCEDQVNLAYLANSSTVENLAHWIQSAKKDCHLVQISTDHVYANSKNQASEIDVPVHMETWYGYTKLLGDAHVQLKCRNYLVIRESHKPYPFPYKVAWWDQHTNGDYVNIIVELIVAKVYLYVYSGL